MSTPNGSSGSPPASLVTRPLPEPRPKQFKIGLDYGTTYSAGAYCLCSNTTRHLESGKIHPFVGYFSNFDMSKAAHTEIPSEIRYEGTNTKIGADALKWTAPTSTTCNIRRAKLGLDDRPETASARAILKRDLARVPGSKGPVQVISDYLSELFTIFRQQLTDVGYEARDSIELNCAVPSIWTHRARRNMVSAIQTAAENSGLRFDSVRLWPEAEAATEYVIKRQPNLDLQTSDVFAVCDAGGGTVDFTTYSVRNSEPLILEEVIQPSGAFCGSTFLDEEFSRHVEALVRANEGLKTRNEQFIQKQLHYAARVFVGQIKHGFQGLKSGNHPVPFFGLSEDPQNGLYTCELIVESKQLLPMFERVAEEVWINLRSQLRKAEELQKHVQFVIFTGGLSRSPFVKEYITKRLAEESSRMRRHENIQLISTATSDYSVAEGSIYCSLKAEQDTRTRRINCFSIGIPYSDEYKKNQKEHNVAGAELQRDEMDKQLYVKNVVNWVLTKGAEQPTETKMTLFQTIPENSPEPFLITVPLYSCDHACKEKYPLGYYEANSQKCHIWEEVTFAIDASVIKSRLKPQTVKTRKPRRRKNSRRPILPSRRSARLNGVNGTMNQYGTLSIAEDDVDGASDTDSTHASDSGSSHALTEAPEDNNSSQKYFHITYEFEMKFVGLLANYEFRCEAAQYSRKGTISLPDQFEFGS